MDICTDELDEPNRIQSIKSVNQSCCLSRKPGSFRILVSNLRHHSWKAFSGTTSTPVWPTWPLKLERKLKAFWMIRCASWSWTCCCAEASTAPFPPVPVPETNAVDCDCDCDCDCDWDWDWSCCILSATLVASSMSMPITTPSAAVPVPPFLLLSLLPPSPPSLNTALSFPGPTPPRNLKSAAADPGPPGAKADGFSAT